MAKKKSKKDSKYECKLLPYSRTDCVSVQEAKQNSGWAITAFDLPKAWEKTKGEDVTIAVLDTGCDLDHPDLLGNLLEGKNFVRSGKPPEDDNGHGCVSPDCLIHTNYSGIEEIENLYNSIDIEETEVNSKEGIYCIKDVSSLDFQTYSFDVELQQTSIGKINSIQKLPIVGDIVVVELENEIKYKLTPWHPVYILNQNNKVIRKRADEIVAGDRFICSKGKLSGNLVNKTKFTLEKSFLCFNCDDVSCFYKNDFSNKCKNCSKFNWETFFEEFEITTDLSWLCAIVITNGKLSKDEFEVNSKTKEILLKIRSICKKYKWNTKIVKEKIFVYGKQPHDYMISMGFDKFGSQDLPKWVGMANNKLISAFIAGVIDGNDFNSKNEIITPSFQFARKFSALLNSLGISSGIKTTDNFLTYRVVHEDLTNEIIEHICDPEKIKKLQTNTLCRKHTRMVESIRIEKYEGHFYDFTIEKYHNYLAEGHFVSNTHVTGILVANDNEIGMVGVCPKAKVRPVKVLDKNGNGNMMNVADGIKWAADQGVDLIVMSLGAPFKVQQVRKAIQYAAQKGVITFCAAGNAGKTEEVFYPANYPETIAIGAIDEKFNRADFSNTGQNLDFMAPGVDIFSTVPDDWYATLSGTSMACPFAVGVAALMIAQSKKGAIEIEIKTADQCRELFRKYTISLNNIDLNDSHFYGGFGIIDPRKICNIIK